MSGVAGRAPDPDPSGALRAVMGRSVDIANQVRDTAVEALRARRDPSLIAQRRCVAARRRLVGWSLAGVMLTAVGVAGVVGMMRDGVGAASVGALVLVLGLWVYCVIGSVQAARDLRVRRALVRQLPPPQPARRPVAGALRPLIAQLDAYSDALRHTMAVIDAAGIGGPLGQLRTETLAAADAAEVRLRGRAAEIGALWRAATPQTRAEVHAAAAPRRQQLADGVAEYGRLVLAAADVAAASRDLTVVAHDDGIAVATERLVALAAGMRELTGQHPDHDR